MRNLILTFILLTSGILFAQKKDSQKLENIYQKIDSIKYSNVDFLKMQKYFNENPEVTKLIEQGDKNAIEFQKILALPYNKANERYGKEKIKTIIHFHNISLRMQEEFFKLNSSKLQREYVEKNKRIIDSIRKN